MRLDEKIALIKSPNITDLADDKVMIDFETGKYFMIKGVGNDIWDMLTENVTAREIIDRLMESYDVSKEECEQSVLEFLEQLKKFGFIK